MYIAAKTILIARQVKLSNKHDFVKVILDENSKGFVIYVIALKIPIEMIIYLF